MICTLILLFEYMQLESWLFCQGVRTRIAIEQHRLIGVQREFGYGIEVLEKLSILHKIE
jgi:hypothetical protein